MCILHKRDTSRERYMVYREVIIVYFATLPLTILVYSPRERYISGGCTQPKAISDFPPAASHHLCALQKKGN